MRKLNSALITLVAAVFLLATLLATSSCTSPRNENVSHQVWLPWLGENGSYQVQKIPVESVSGWAPIRGTAVEMRKFVARKTKTTFIAQEIMLEYTHDSDGTLIPLTRFSTEVAAIYANFERFQKLDKELSLPQSDVARRVYVKFIKEVPGGFFDVNNAYYDAEVDAFFIVPYQLKGLPLSVNGAVLAHEHFHSIFARLLWNPLMKSSEALGKKFMRNSEFHPHEFARSQFGGPENQEEPGPPIKTPSASSKLPIEGSDSTLTLDSKKTQYLNRSIFYALNEGLADVWGWMYSGDPCFMKPSFRETFYQQLDESGTQFRPRDVAGERCLTTNPALLRITGRDALAGRYESGEELDRQARKQGYLLGTDLSRLVYLRMDERGELKDPVSRRRWAQRIVDVLPTFLAHLKKVLVEEDGRASVLQWEKMVDTLLFGPGASSVPAEKCERWKSILKTTEPLENFKSHCAGH
jgi:hypothetical protein